MKILLSPQVRDDNKIWYEVNEEKITVTINDITDTFDFTGLPNGVLKLLDDEGNSLIKTTLPEIPIIRAEKVDGELTVEILFSINIDETDERLLFPEPMDVEEFNNLMRLLKWRNDGKKFELMVIEQPKEEQPDAKGGDING